MSSIISIMKAVKRKKESKEMKKELAEARQERQEAAEERRIMQEQLQVLQSNGGNGGTYNHTGSNPNQPANAMYPEAESLPPGTVSPYAGAQPIGVPMQGVPVQVSAPSYPYQVNEPGAIPAGAPVYCQECESHHAAPACQRLSLRERLAGRREERRARRG